MAVTYLELVDTDQIRAKLGASDKELSDTTLATFDIENELKGDLLGWIPTYEDVIDAGTAGSPTTSEELQYLKLLSYSKNYTSWIVGVSAQNLLKQKISDGSNEMQRFNFSQEKLLDTLKSEADKSKADILELIDSTSSNTYSQFGAVTSTFDPVTNA